MNYIMDAPGLRSLYQVPDGNHCFRDCRRAGYAYSGQYCAVSLLPAIKITGQGQNLPAEHLTNSLVKMAWGCVLTSPASQHELIY